MFEHQFHEKVLKLLEAIYTCVRPRLSATLTYNRHGEKRMFTLRLNETRSPVFLEFDGPSGTGNQVPPVGPVTYVSSDPATIAVDQNTGVVTGVKVSTAPVTITATDTGDNIVATTQGNVTDSAQSATLDYPAPSA